MVVKAASPCQAFDVDQILTASEAATFVANGYAAVGRYIPRIPENIPGNLTSTERDILLNAGLGVYTVQHCPEDNWMPTAALGTAYGAYAATYLKQIGMPSLVSTFLDLEMVNKNAVASDIIAYCEAWFKEVSVANFTPGLYCGWQTGLTPQQLYDLGWVASYWKGYNADIPIPKRGYCITQHPQQRLNGIYFDPNTIAPDELGGLPMLLYPS